MTKAEHYAASIAALVKEQTRVTAALNRLRSAERPTFYIYPGSLHDQIAYVTEDGKLRVNISTTLSLADWERFETWRRDFFETPIETPTDIDAHVRKIVLGQL